MTMYRIIAVNESEELNLSDSAFMSEQIDAGRKYYSGGFELYSFDTDDLNEDTDIEDVMELIF